MDGEFDILEQLPDEEEVDLDAGGQQRQGPQRRSLPDGQYIAELQSVTPEESDYGPRLVVRSRARGQVTSSSVENRYVGAFLPIQRIPLDEKPNERGNRRDFRLWQLADAILGRERRQDIHRMNPTYGSCVRFTCVELAERIAENRAFFLATKTTRSSGGRSFDNVDRAEPLPNGLEPL